MRKLKEKIRDNHIPWQPPPSGCVKVNFDGAVGEAGGVGMVVRDEKGQFVAAAVVHSPQALVAGDTEAYAAREAVSL
ncbi:hypothetical protein CerSpe_079580 [Prunus speciosa]